MSTPTNPAPESAGAVWKTDAPSGYAWHCPDCDSRATLGGNAAYHAQTQGHGLPTLRPLTTPAAPQPETARYAEADPVFDPNAEFDPTNGSEYDTPAPQPETAERIVRDVFERRGVPIREDFLSETETCCTRPPKGWLCTRGAHPDGTPCAAVPDEATDYRLIEAWTHGHNAQCAADADDLERAKDQIAKCMERLDSLVDSSAQPETEGMTEAERIEIANLTAEINLAIYNTIPNVTLAQVERVNVRAILTAAKKGGR